MVDELNLGQFVDLDLKPAAKLRNDASHTDSLLFEVQSKVCNVTGPELVENRLGKRDGEVVLIPVIGFGVEVVAFGGVGFGKVLYRHFDGTTLADELGDLIGGNDGPWGL